MVNLFDYAHDNKLFKKFKVNDLLFTEYKCTESRTVFPVWSHYNYFVYVLSGKKQWQTLDAEFLVQSGEAIFVRRGAHIIHKFFEVEFCALFIFVPDSFIVDICQNHSLGIPENKGMVADTVFPLQMEESLSSYFQSVFSYFLRNEAPPVSLAGN